MTENENDKARGPAKPLYPVEEPARLAADRRGLVERALEAHEEAAENLERSRKEREESEWQFALSRLTAAFGGDEDTFSLVDSDPYEDNQWVTTWSVEEDEGFGLVVIRQGRGTVVHLTSFCDEHGAYAVAHQLDPTLADLGRHLARREEWFCPGCKLEELRGEMAEGEADLSKEALVGREIVRVIEATVRGVLLAERDAAVAEMAGSE